MNHRINTILFDLDGTLIDTNELIIQSFLYTLNKYYPGQYTREDILPFIGPPLIDSFLSVNPKNAEEMVKVYREFNHDNHDVYTKTFDGVYETVKALHDHGFKLGIVSTKLCSTVKKGLKFAKLDPFFEVIVALDHVKKAKPDPEPIFNALSQLHASPKEAIMVGDNYHDILGGKNAGTKTAAVAWSLKGEDFLAKYEPDYMLKHMSDLLSIVGVTKI